MLVRYEQRRKGVQYGEEGREKVKVQGQGWW
jgi:hypothetical protein